MFKRNLQIGSLLIMLLFLAGFGKLETMPQSEVEKTAIKAMVQYMEALNSKSPVKLKAIDIRTKDVKDEELVAYLSQGTNYVLKNIVEAKLQNNKITGKMLYAYEVKGNGIGKTINLAYTNISLKLLGKSWVLENASPVKENDETKESMKVMEERLKIAEEGKQKYGVDDLSKWSGL